MTNSTRDNAQTRKPRAKQLGDLVGTRFQPDLLHEIDTWRRDQPDLPTRPEAIRRLVQAALAKA